MNFPLSDAIERAASRQAWLALRIEMGALPDNPLEWLLARAWQRWAALKGLPL